MKHIIKQIEELIPVSNEPLSKFDLGYTKGLIDSFLLAVEVAKELTNNTGESYCVLNGSKDEAHSFGYCVLTEKEANAQEYTSNRILKTIYPQEKHVTLTEFIAKIKAEHGGEYPFDCGFRDACEQITIFIED